MAQPRFATRGLMGVAVVFLIVAFLPVARGGSLNAAFLALAVVFFVIGIAAGKKKGGTDSPPPAA